MFVCDYSDNLYVKKTGENQWKPTRWMIDPTLLQRLRSHRRRQWSCVATNTCRAPLSATQQHAQHLATRSSSHVYITVQTTIYASVMMIWTNRWWVEVEDGCRAILVPQSHRPVARTAEEDIRRERRPRQLVNRTLTTHVTSQINIK